VVYNGMGGERSSFLKERALAFLDIAKTCYERKYYSLVLFNVEQFIQLYLKHLIYVKLGDFPKTHSLIQLFKSVIKVYGDCEIKDFYRRNLEILYLLEEAYVSSRYLPRKYEEEIAERTLNFANKMLKVFECLEKH